MIIVSIDTSQAASVALVDSESGEVLAAEQADDQRRHVEFIGPALHRVLAHPSAPDLVVTGIGPGPFTGLRVGIAAGIAVGAARGIPVKGMLSHAALAEELSMTGTVGGPVLVAGDARRREVYFSVYGPSAGPSVGTSAAAGTSVGTSAAAGTGVADGTSATDVGLDLLAGPFVAKPAEVGDVLADAGYGGLLGSESGGKRRAGVRIGRGFLLYEDILGAPNPATLLDPRAEYLALAAARALRSGTELPEPIPEYLREPDAKAAPVRESRLK